MKHRIAVLASLICVSSSGIVSGCASNTPAGGDTPMNPPRSGVDAGSIDSGDAGIEGMHADGGDLMPEYDSGTNGSGTRDSGMNDGGTPSSTDAGGSDVDAGSGSDAGTDGGTYVEPDPSTRNIGWIGGSCSDASSCFDVSDAICLDTPYSHGLCSQECVSSCPDRHGAGDSVTFCIDGAPFDYPMGLCAARCDRTLFPATGCQDGYRCEPRNRFGDAYVSHEVCVPEVVRACETGSDALIPIHYPDRGALWIPTEAQCGGSFDLVVMLHGINPGSLEAGSLGGGRNVQQLVRGLIDGGQMDPVILAEPVHFQGSSSRLYGAEFDFHEHLRRVYAELEARGIVVRSLSYVGHSGAGCDNDNGMFRLATELDEIIPMWAPELKLFGFQDICYNSIDRWATRLASVLDGSTAFVNMTTTGGNPTTMEREILGTSTTTPSVCHPDLMSRCVAHPSLPYCSYSTTFVAGLTHRTNPYYFVREIFPQVFRAGARPCR